MPPSIASFPSVQYYAGKLITLQDQRDPPVRYHWPSADLICFNNVDGHGEKHEGNAIHNPDEATCVINAVYWLVQDTTDVSWD